MICWKPCRYSCSSAGTMSCLLFHLDASSLSRAGGGGSLHSGKKTIKDKGSRVSSSNFSKWTMVASISSSQKGGLASKEPQWGLKSRIDLEIIVTTNYSRWNLVEIADSSEEIKDFRVEEIRLFCKVDPKSNKILTLSNRNMNQCQRRLNNTGGNSNWAAKQSTPKWRQSFYGGIPRLW